MAKLKNIEQDKLQELLLEIVSKETKPIPPFILMRKAIKEKKQKDVYISDHDFN